MTILITFNTLIHFYNAHYFYILAMQRITAEQILVCYDQVFCQLVCVVPAQQSSILFNKVVCQKLSDLHENPPQ